MTEIQAQEWKRVRAKGGDRFVMREGVFRQGLLDAGIAAAVWIVVHSPKYQSAPSVLEVWNWLAGLGVLMLGAGWFQGIRLWEMREKEYEAYLLHSGEQYPTAR